MKINLKIISILIICILLSSCSLPFSPDKKAGLSITASPNAGIFLNDSHVGSTPYYNEKMKTGEYAIKIVPESGIGLPWESKITLLPGIMTVISRQLGQTEESSSGYFLTLQPDGNKDKANIEVVTVPDKSVINIDGESRGFSPIALDNITSGEHVILVTAPGYIERSINANLRTGHVLKASIQLARSEIATNSAQNIETTTEASPSDQVLDDKATTTPKATSNPKPKTNLKPPYITVLDTPTGYLNVRQEPSTSSSENIIAKIKPGESYVFLEKNNSGWDKIEIAAGEEGWVSSKYVKLTEE